MSKIGEISGSVIVYNVLILLDYYYLFLVIDFGHNWALKSVGWRFDSFTAHQKEKDVITTS